MRRLAAVLALLLAPAVARAAVQVEAESVYRSWDTPALAEEDVVLQPFSQALRLTAGERWENSRIGFETYVRGIGDQTQRGPGFRDASRVYYAYLDLVYGRSPANVARLVGALAPFQPYLRDAPPGLPFSWDEATIARGLNFTLTTTLGDLDLLGEITGGGRFEDLLRRAEPIELEDRRCSVVTLPTLIELKRAAGRPRDRDALAELEALLEERGGQ